MTSPHKNEHPSLDAYTVGWVCVKEIELTAARILLDETYQCPEIRDSEYSYLVGQMMGHKVAIVRSNSTGRAAAAVTAVHLVRTFRNIRFVLMVGVGGGVRHAPSPPGSLKLVTDIFLGDVVVSAPHGEHGGIWQYDKGKQENGEYQSKAHLNKPGRLLMQATGMLRSNHAILQGNMKQFIQEATETLQKGNPSCQYPPSKQYDRLFTSDYEHVAPDENDDEICIKCDGARLVKRTPRGTPVVHYGLIASGDTLMRDANMRDRMRRLHNVLCFEMESAGLMDDFPCLAIRGIADYADSHKNDLWQPYAALTAAAYAKDLLSVIQRRNIEDTDTAYKILEKMEKINYNLKVAQNGIDGIHTKLDSNYRAAIVNGLSDFDFNAEQQKRIMKRIPTGQWLLELQAFQCWVKGTRWRLCIYGETGIGKSYLCALVVLHLQMKPEPRPVLYLYLDDSNHGHTWESMLGSLVQQLLSFDSEVDIPHMLRTSSSSQRYYYSSDTLEAAFRLLLTNLGGAYLIVDGLYYCPEDVGQSLKDYTRTLINEGVPLSLLMTSQGYREVDKLIHCDLCQEQNLDIFFNCPCNERDFDICLRCKEAGASCPNKHQGQEPYDTLWISAGAHEGEITQFCAGILTKASTRRRCDARLYSQPPFRSSGVAWFLARHPETIGDVARVISSKAQNNFLVAYAWLQDLLETDRVPENYDDLRSRLDDIPVNVLGRHFTKRIEKMESYKSLSELTVARRTFSILGTVCRPINILTLQQALELEQALELDPDLESWTSFNKAKPVYKRVAILRATNGFITVAKADPANSFVRLFHGTLESMAEAERNPLPALKASHSDMAVLCMKHIQHSDFAARSGDPASYPFASYALKHWGDHVRKAGRRDNDDNVVPEALRLLKKPATVAAVAEMTRNLCPESYCWMHGEVSALHLCAWYDLPMLIQKLHNRDYDINVLEPRTKRSPLQYACAKASLESVKKLLELKAETSDVAIACAIDGLPDTDRPSDEEEDRVEIVERILNKDGRTLDNKIDQEGTTVLMHAVKNGYYNFVAMLLAKCSPDVNIQDNYGLTALWLAAGANPAHNIPVNTALRGGVVGLLLERNTDPNMRCSFSGNTALSNAIQRGSIESIFALLECDRLEISDAKDLVCKANQRRSPEIIQMVHSALIKRGLAADSIDVNPNVQSASPALDALPIKGILTAATGWSPRGSGVDLDIGVAVDEATTTPTTVLTEVERATAIATQKPLLDLGQDGSQSLQNTANLLALAQLGPVSVHGEVSPSGHRRSQSSLSQGNVVLCSALLLLVSLVFIQFLPLHTASLCLRLKIY
ncbi:hypothetical protein BJY00DRAFT_282768 [Aspergillus carlsbadensis]|nr:hypothetical protein BJY00DRAFT_282768 [Aspergillus carlsbadensis]